MKRKTRLEFFKKSDLMMNLVVKWDFGGGACGNGGETEGRMKNSYLAKCRRGAAG